MQKKWGNFIYTLSIFFQILFLFTSRFFSKVHQNFKYHIMENKTEESTVCLTNKTSDEILIDLKGVCDKSKITNLKITDAFVVEVQKSFFHDFNHLINLNLSNCNIFWIQHGSFRTLIHLESINLSNNIINEIDSDLFEMNINLTQIYLEHNLIIQINKDAFSMLVNLKSLNLSSNKITLLAVYCLNCPNLQKLDLSCNKIEEVNFAAFYQITKLKYLVLDSNKIRRLNSGVFVKSKEIKVLSLSNNVMSRINWLTIRPLQGLKVLRMNNNLMKQILTNGAFSYNCNLNEIDLSDNRIRYVSRNAFKECHNLKCLKLSIDGDIEMHSIDKLRFLNKFELFLKSRDTFLLKKYFWDKLQNKNALKILKLVVQNVNVVNLCNFSSMHNLESLHIECVTKNIKVNHVRFKVTFNPMPKLETLIFKRLNFFLRLVFQNNVWTIKTTKLTHLDFTGLQNHKIDYILSKFVLLEYLNLSFSEIVDIHPDAFINLIHLKTVNLEHSKLKLIRKELFENNCYLKIINCANCKIETIEEFSFQNLHLLETLNLKNNYLTRLDENTLTGLDRDKCNVYLDFEI